MCDVERAARPEMGWFCKTTGKPIVHTTPLGMYCEDKCGYDANAEMMEKVTELMGDPQEFLNKISGPGGFSNMVSHIARQMDTPEMRELYQSQKQLDPELDKKVEQFETNIDEVFSHGNNSRKE